MDEHLDLTKVYNPNKPTDDSEEKEIFNRSHEIIDEITERLGYEDASLGYLNLDEDEEHVFLDDNEKEKLKWLSGVINDPVMVRFLTLEKANGKIVKAVIKVLTGKEPSFTAEVFSPAFNGGHRGGENLNEEDLEELLESAKI